MKKFTASLLVLIIFISLAVRLFKLADLPAILNRDEAGLAYNALLLKETGMDEWGRTWPLTLESFGDYKLPGYPAMLVVLFTFLPENDAVVRLPSVLAGVFLPVLAYVLLLRSKWDRVSALVGATVVAATPVFFFYSRIGFEAMVGLALLLWALYLLYRDPYSKLNRVTQDVLATVVWLVAALTYNTPLLLLPFFIPLVIFGRGYLHIKRWLTPVVGLVVVFGFLFANQLSLTQQKSGITIFTDETHRELANARYTSYTGPARMVFGSKYVYFAEVMSKNILATVSPRFMLTNGGSHPLHQPPNTGHLTVAIYLFGLLGILTALSVLLQQLFKKKKILKVFKKHSFEFLLVYISVVSLAPAVITVDAPHATRSLLFFFCLGIASAYAVKKLKKNIGTLFIVVTVLLFARYVSQYFEKYPTQQPELLQVGYDDVIREVDENTDGQVAVVDPDGYQYILTAWYLQTEPSVFYSTIVRQLPNTIGFKYGQQMDRYHFIGNAEDRVPEEKVVVEWKDGAWQVQHF